MGLSTGSRFMIGVITATGFAACSGLFADKPDSTPGVDASATPPLGHAAGAGGSLGEDRFAVGEGLLGCPTVAYPIANTKGVGLSPGFTEHCATCHGGSGERQASYPKLPGDQDVASI